MKESPEVGSLTHIHAPFITACLISKEKENHSLAHKALATPHNQWETSTTSNWFFSSKFFVQNSPPQFLLKLNASKHSLCFFGLAYALPLFACPILQFLCCKVSCQITCYFVFLVSGRQEQGVWGSDYKAGLFMQGFDQE